MKPCGDCNLCCTGYLLGEVEDIPFGNLNKCHRLIDKKCSIYEDRPDMCKKYYCAWAQGLFPDWMKPNKSDIVISIEVDTLNRQYLKAISPKKLLPNVRQELEIFCKNNDTYFVEVLVLKILPI